MEPEKPERKKRPQSEKQLENLRRGREAAKLAAATRKLEKQRLAELEAKAEPLEEFKVQPKPKKNEKPIEKPIEKPVEIKVEKPVKVKRVVKIIEPESDTEDDSEDEDYIEPVKVRKSKKHEEIDEPLIKTKAKQHKELIKKKKELLQLEIEKQHELELAKLDDEMNRIKNKKYYPTPESTEPPRFIFRQY